MPFEPMRQNAEANGKVNGIGLIHHNYRQKAGNGRI